MSENKVDDLAPKPQRLPIDEQFVREIRKNVTLERTLADLGELLPERGRTDDFITRKPEKEHPKVG